MTFVKNRDIFLAELKAQAICYFEPIVHFDISKVARRPQYRRTLERGANENTNGLIRQYIPKGTDFSTLTDEYIAEVEWKLNNRPRLGYLTPLEYFKKMYNFTSDSVVALSN